MGLAAEVLCRREISMNTLLFWMDIVITAGHNESEEYLYLGRIETLKDSVH